MATLVRDVLWRIGDVIQDVDPQFVRWPERELVRWLNDAQNAIATLLPLASSRVEALKLSVGCLQSIESIVAANRKKWDGTAPTDVARGTQVLGVQCLMGAAGTTPGKALRGPFNRRLLDAQDPMWQSEVGEPDGWLFDPENPRHFWLTPGVTGNLWARVSYAALPTAIPAGGPPSDPIYEATGNSTLNISLGDEYVQDLVNYVVARAMSKDSKFADPAKGAQATQLFIGSLNAKVQAISGSNPNLKRLPMVPEPIGAAS